MAAARSKKQEARSMAETGTEFHQPHTAVLNFPFSTHPSSVLSIINRLAVAAPDALFTFFSTAKSNKALFSSSTCTQLANNVKPCDVSDGVPEGYAFTGKRQEDIELFMNAADANFRRAVAVAVADTGRTLTCLVTDAFVWPAAQMAQDWNVPWIPCWTAGPNSLAAHLYTDIIRDKCINQNHNQQLDFIPGMSKVRVSDLPEGVVSGNLQSVFSIMLHHMGRQLPRASAVFINSFEELDPELTSHFRTKFNKFFSVGPFNLLQATATATATAKPDDFDDEHGCLAWLDKQKKPGSVAYISFGTVAAPSPEEILAIAEALETNEVPFVWSLKRDLQAKLPNGFLERTKSYGFVVDWAPQVKLLAHQALGVFITHCGWGSILESIAAGVPMIGRPFFGDQPINTRLMEQVWQIGVPVVDGGICTKNALLSALDLILCQEKGSQLRENATKLKLLCESAIRPGGSSMHNFDALLHMISTS